MLNLITDFECAFGEGAPWKHAPKRPTSESLDHIVQVMGLPGLPSLLIKLASETYSFGRWFGGLGPDYEDGKHTLCLNAYWRGEGLPDSLFLLTYGFDGICDCLDIASADDPDILQVVQIQLPCEPGECHQPYAPTFEAYLGKIIKIFGEDKEQGTVEKI